jgi:hypothetical protein
MSRLKLKSITALLNNKDFFKLFNSIFNKIDYNCFIIFQDYLNGKKYHGEGKIGENHNICGKNSIAFIQ